MEVEAEREGASNYNEGVISTMVEVKVYNLKWLFKGKKDFSDIVPLLLKTNNEYLYESASIHTLIYEFWKGYKDQLLKSLVIPYFVHLILIISFLILQSNNPGSTDEGKLVGLYVTGGLALVTWCY